MIFKSLNKGKIQLYYVFIQIIKVYNHQYQVYKSYKITINLIPPHRLALLGGWTVVVEL